MKINLSLSLLGALVTLMLASVFPDLFQQWEWKTVDLRFVVRGPIPTDNNLVLIDADDASATVYGQWPWKRSIHARMIDFLKTEGVRTIAYDILFAHPADGTDDAQLVESVKNAGNVVFPVATESFGIGDLPSATESIPPFPELQDTGVMTGHIAANRDGDGVIRRVPLFVRHKGKLMPALALQAVMNYLGVNDFEIKAGHILLRQAGKTIDIPVDSKGQMLINYAGRWQETFKHASFIEALSASEGSTGEDLSGKLVLVSNTLSGHDIKPVPFERDYPGGGIHANIINTILTQNFLKETHTSTNHGLTLVLCLFTALIFSRRNYVLQTGAVFLLIAVYAFIGIGFFKEGVVIPLLAPVLSIILTALMVAIYRASIEKESSTALLEEKSRVESSLLSISKDLAGREAELEKIQTLLGAMSANLAQDRERGEQQEGKIADLQEKLRSLMGDKEKLLAQRTELENKVLDLRVHISFDPSGSTDANVGECGKHGIVTRNQAVFEVFRILKQVAGTTSPVLILGESGTGKELFARAVHVIGGRKGGFVPINMGAIAETLIESELFGHEKGAFTGAFKSSKGKFLEAGGGTLFMDEIGEMKSDMQVKLLRVLQEKEVQPVGGRAVKVDVRIVAATNKDLEKAIRDGMFREDLFYRLNTITLKLPPLRDRKEDIEILALHFMEKYRTEYGKEIQGISDKAMKKLMEHDWPGNIRELENVIQRGVTLATGVLIQEKDLGLKSKQPETTANKTTALGEGDSLLLNVLRDNRFEINKTAAQLNMSRNTVASRFKGICFDLLVLHRQDREKAAEAICNGGTEKNLVLQRITEYHDNLIKSGFATEEEAVTDALKRAKNVPLQYHSAIETLTRMGYKPR